MRTFAALAALLFATEASAYPQLSLTFQSEPYPGIQRETWQDSNPSQPVRIRLIRIDLTSSEIAVYATKEADRGLTTSEYAERIGAQVAINGDSFSVNGYVPRGLAMGDGNTWANTADDSRSAMFHFRRQGERTVGAITHPEPLLLPSDLPDGTEGVISGRPLLVRQSQVASEQFDCNDPVSIDCQVAPRTAIGVSPDGNRLLLAVVDGWQDASHGITLPDLAEFMRQRGAGMAMALDSGASSTLVLGGMRISSPSDGVERPVANHLGIKYGMLPKGQLYGLICRHDVFGCGDDPARKISGAQVWLDDGRMQTTDSSGVYNFINVTPRLACVTVKKTGYLTVHQCKQVAPGPPTYNSVAMWEGKDQPDAGVGEDAGIPPDASVARDAQTGDGGNDYTGPGAGCCDSGRDRPSVELLVLVAWFLMRRRGTTA